MCELYFIVYTIVNKEHTYIHLQQLSERIEMEQRDMFPIGLLPEIVHTN